MHLCAIQCTGFQSLEQTLAGTPMAPKAVGDSVRRPERSALAESATVLLGPPENRDVRAFHSPD